MKCNYGLNAAQLEILASFKRTDIEIMMIYGLLFRFHYLALFFNFLFVCLICKGVATGSFLTILSLLFALVFNFLYFREYKQIESRWLETKLIPVATKARKMFDCPERIALFLMIYVPEFDSLILRAIDRSQIDRSFIDMVLVLHQEVTEIRLKILNDCEEFVEKTIKSYEKELVGLPFAEQHRLVRPKRDDYLASQFAAALQEFGERACDELGIAQFN